MKKLLLAIAAIAAMAFAAPAFADHTIIAVSDPTPDQSFSGDYATGQEDDPNTAEDESTGHQQGYVGVYNDGVVACNGNPELTRPDNGSPLVGYIFVGDPSSNNAPSNTSGGGAAGPVAVGNNHENADGSGTPTGESPCPDGDPQGVNE